MTGVKPAQKDIRKTEGNSVSNFPGNSAGNSAMNPMEKPAGKTYICIDLKSFYASVECMERGLDPLTTNLVVADVSRTEKTICLAVSPSLKAYGIPGRARLFEVVQRVKEANAARRRSAPGHTFSGSSISAPELEQDPSLELSYLAAVPRMALYMETSARIYRIYMRYLAPEDVHVYSVDEVMMDVTHYLDTYGMTAHELAKQMIREVYQETGITATAGIGTNLYLAKVAMDIMAKHVEADEDGVRIAYLDEMSYRRELWTHKPLTDFWRVGRGYTKKLAQHGMQTMGDVARCSEQNEELLYSLFGVNAELLIDHAWGWEPCTMDLIKAYQPESHSFSTAQVLQEPYTFEKTRVVVHEMADAAALDLVKKRLVTDQLTLTIGYDIENLDNPEFHGEVTTDWYGRRVPKHAHGTANLPRLTSSSRLIDKAVLDLFDRIADPHLLARRINLTVNHVTDEAEAKPQEETYEQMDLFTDYAALEAKRKQEDEELDKDRKLQEAMLSIQQRYGKNAILKGLNFKEGATGRDRNAQIGGHKA